MNYVPRTARDAYTAVREFLAQTDWDLEDRAHVTGYLQEVSEIAAEALTLVEAGDLDGVEKLYAKLPK